MCPAVRAILSTRTTSTSIPLYPVSPLAPAGARAISPHEVASWLVSTKDAKKFLYACDWPYMFNAK